MLPLPSSVTACPSFALWSGPAFAVGAAVMVMSIWSVTAVHVPLPVVVSVSVTDPVVLSVAVGRYVAVSVVLFGVNVPAPPDHAAPVAMVNDPPSVTSALLAHTVWSVPAFTVGAGVNVINIWSLTALHVPLPVVVRVSVTEPFDISDADGVYTAVSVVLFGENDPAPPDHAPPDAIVIFPASVVAVLFAHFVWSTPAFAVGGAEKVIVTWSVTAVHVPFPVVVRVSVTLPFEVSVAVGVYTAFKDAEKYEGAVVKFGLLMDAAIKEVDEQIRSLLVHHADIEKQIGKFCDAGDQGLIEVKWRLYGEVETPDSDNGPTLQVIVLE